MREGGLLLLLCALAQGAPQVRIGNYEVTLRLPSEGLHAGEEMQIEYRVVDVSRIDPVMGPVPVIRAATRSVIDMPSMPSMAKMVETAHPEGVPGEYGVHPWFPHGGEYQLQLHITPPGGQEFTAKFPLAVGDFVEAKGRKRVPAPFYLNLQAVPRVPKAGEEVDLLLTVHARATQNAVVQEFDIQHERPMHLLIVRKDLGLFAHEHPEPSGEGRFRLRYRFPTGGEYHLFADAAPRGAGGKIMLAKVKVSGSSADGFSVRQQSPGDPAIGESVAMTWDTRQYPTGRTLRLVAAVSDKKTGMPVDDLQPYLGALGHLILIHEDGETLVHSHPEESAMEQHEPGKLVFLARFPKPGRYRGWAQVQRRSMVETAAFVVDGVRP
jgi:hypothetical protein